VLAPAGNPITLDKTNLGKVLFWDEQLSTTRNVACGTCHMPESGGSDSRSAPSNSFSAHPGADGVIGTADDVVGSPGVVRGLDADSLDKDGVFGLRPQVTGRKSQSMINAAFSPLLFWDGRAAGTFVDPVTGAVVLPMGGALESQAAGPPVSDIEMAHAGRDWSEVVSQLEQSEPLALAEDIPPALEGWVGDRSYAELFEDAFGTAEITAARVLMAIATYERTLVSDQAPFDAFIAGNPVALTPPEMRGWGVFNGPGRCDLCHMGPLLTDQEFHNIGVRPSFEDIGRQEVTSDPIDRGAFKTPSLRNVELRAPYFHNGSAATLTDVVNFYNRGGDFQFNQDPLIRPLGLGPGPRADLVAFLGRALTDPRVENATVPFDRPTLFSESSRAPGLLGAPTPGTGGAVPQMIANEPAHAGNPSMTVGIDGGLGGGFAALLFDPVPNPAGLTFNGASIHLGLSSGLRNIHVELLQGLGPGAGWGSYSVGIPGNVSFLGSSVYLQWLLVEPGLGSLAATAAAELPVF